MAAEANPEVSLSANEMVSGFEYGGKVCMPAPLVTDWVCCASVHLIWAAQVDIVDEEDNVIRQERRAVMVRSAMLVSLAPCLNLGEGRRWCEGAGRVAMPLVPVRACV
jgi:hypothetical protein